MNRTTSYGQSLADAAIEVSGTPVALSPSSRTRSALVTVSGGSVRYRFYGDPTATVGHIVADGGNVELFRDDIGRVKFVATTGTVDLFVTYFGEA